MAASLEKLQIAEAILLRLDASADKDPGKPDPSVSFQVRVVWLASGLSGDEAAKPARDLNDVIDELSDVGVEGLGQVGQVLVNTTPDGRFQVCSSPTVGGSPADWEIAGQFESRQGTPVLKIQLSARQLFTPAGTGKGGATTEGGSIQVQTLVTLETAIAAPPNHYVVLGTAPVAVRTGEMTSAFVLQVTPNKKD